MTAQAVVFWIFAALTVGSAAVVVLSRTLIYSAFALLATFFGVAGLYLLLGADFLAATQLLVYVGGILVLLLFGVMLTQRIYDLDLRSGTIQLGSGSSQATLLIGGNAGEGVTHAKDQSRPAVITIDASLLADATKDAAEYRQKDLFDARAFNATRIEIVRAGATVVFEKQKSKDKDGNDVEKWQQTSPESKEPDQTKVEDLLAAVTGARATSFVDSTAKTGLDAPELTATVASDEGKRQEKVAFARSGSDGFALRTGEPGAARVDIAAIENIVKALEALK